VRKGMIIWAMIIAVVVLWAVLQSSGLFCEHEYRVTNDCFAKSCTLCGRTEKVKEAEHDYVQVDCIHATCRRCGLESVQEGAMHLKWCANYNKCHACGKDMTQYRNEHPDYHPTKEVNLTGCRVANRCTVCSKDITVVNKEHVVGNTAHLVDAEQCLVATTCKNCGESIRINHKMVTTSVGCNIVEKCLYCFGQGDVLGEEHEWVYENCEELRRCSECGITDPLPSWHKHSFEGGFLRVFDTCSKCGLRQYETSALDIVSRLAEVFGVLLVAFGFQYAIRKRKFMRINWLIVIFLWLEENTFFGNFTPAVLWKKKLD